MLRITPTTEPDSLTSAKSYAFKLLGRRAYSKNELMQRLHDKGFNPDICQNTIKLLEEYGYVNDWQLAMREIERCLKEQKLGPRRLQLRLRQRGIAPEIINQVMSSVDQETVYSSCMQEARKKLATLSDISPEKKQARLGSFLLRRGFDLECVNRCLRKIL
ncbi:MAG: regulatory protein RecX [Firmicutes bacterium]|nr:regulatory protein RecX [Bacillota bacterium]